MRVRTVDTYRRYAACALTAALSAIAVSSVAIAATIDVDDNHGGRVKAYDARWAAAAARGDSVRIVGPCQSACTVLLGHIPRSQICVTPNASFGFHLAKTLEATTILRNAYASDIKGWI